MNRAFILRFRVSLPPVFGVIGLLLTVAGALLHIWTGKLLGIFGLMGLPEISRKIRGRLVTEGPFSLVRNPTYLAHALLFLGIFLWTGVIAVGAVTLLDFLLINLLIIPLEERELSSRFGKDYETYKEKVRFRMLPWI